MSEILKSFSHEETLQAVRNEQNAIDNDLRESFLNINLFQDSHFEATDLKELLDLRSEFMEEKIGKDMTERFRMAINPKYFDKIRVVELGSAKAPFSKVGVDDLKHEYHELLDCLIKENYLDHETSRADSGRSLEVNIPSDINIAKERIVIVRIRPLVDAVSPDGKKGIGIVKRMVFSMPTLLYQGTIKAANELARRADLNLDMVMLQVIEAMLDRNDKRIDPIRTGYYLATELIGKTQSSIDEDSNEE